MRPQPWAMLMVCTGNVCRSPLAERLAASTFAAALEASVPTQATRPVDQLLRVGSAGLRAWSGQPMHPRSAASLLARGVDASGFSARDLTRDLIGDADLVLCATRVHRAAVLKLDPRAMHRAFTLLEFDRLTAGVDPGDVPAGPGPHGVRTAGEFLVAAARRARAVGDVAATTLDDLIDPLDGDQAAFDECARTVEEALSRPMALLAAAAREIGDEPAGPPNLTNSPSLTSPPNLTSPPHLAGPPHPARPPLPASGVPTERLGTSECGF